MYAVTEIKGFQYRVEKGETLRVPKFDVEVGKKITIPEVMLVSDKGDVKVGTPYVDGAVVSATVTGHDRYDKVTVFKKKRRKDYSVKKGHRQDYTEIVIDDITVGATKKKAEATPAEKPAPAENKEVKAEEAKAPAKEAAPPKKKAAPKVKKTVEKELDEVSESAETQIKADDTAVEEKEEEKKEVKE